MSIYEENGKIIVDEMRPMSDAPKMEQIIVCHKGSMMAARWFHNNMFMDCNGWMLDASKLDGWLPMPIYRPKDGG